jgi:tetratricopeptide (TPR) repeat protein
MTRNDHRGDRHSRRLRGPVEARRIAEEARAAGLGDAPDVAAQQCRDVLTVLGESEVTTVHADVLRWHGTVLRDRGRTSEAEPLYRRSLEIARRLGYQVGVAHALNCLAALSQRRGNLRHAGHLLADAALLAEASGELRLLSMIHSNLGILADIRGDAFGAISHYRAALWSSETANDDQGTVWVLVNFAALLGRSRSYADADHALRRGLSLARVRGDLLSEGILEENRAETLLARGEVEEAFPAIRRALEIAAQRRDDVRTAGALKVRGAYERMVGRVDDSLSTLRHGLTLAAVGEDALLGGEMLYQFGLTLHASNSDAMAREVWGAAFEAFDRIEAREWCGRVQETIVLGPSGNFV